MAEGFEVGQAFIRISPDTSDFAEQLRSQVEEATAGAEGRVKVGADDAELDEVLDDAKAKLDALDGKDATARLRVDAADLDAKADDATARLRELGETEATARLRMDAADFDAEGDDARARLDEFDGREASARLRLDMSEWDAQIAEAGAQLEGLRTRAAGIRLGGAGGGEGAGGGGGAEGGEGSLLGAITLVGGGLLPGVGGAAAGLGLLGGTGALAFGGIAKALGAAHQASQNVGLTGAQLASTNFSNQVQIVQAQQQVDQARRQSAQDAITSNQQIQSADENLAETERNTAASRVQALQQVTEAQQGVQTATYSLSEANYNLAQAYEQAREKIAQAQDQLADSKLSVQSASLAVQQAEYQEKLVNQDAYSTSLDRQQATLAVAQAKQQLQDATDSQSAAEYQANLVTKQGVNGSQDVIQAKQAQLSATNQLSNAQKSLSEANTNLTNTELNNQAQLKEAQAQATMAREQAAYQQKSDAIAVAQAERNLTDTIEEQRLQMAAMQSTANQAANQFLKDMAKLTPAGRSFVNQILGMRGQFKGLQADAQNATLPGFTGFLRGAATLIPVVKSGVAGMGTAISNAFAGFGRQLATPQAAQVLQGLISNGMEFVNTVLPAIGSALGAIFSLGSSKGAATGLSQLLKGVFQGIQGFATGLKPYIPDFNALFEALGKIAKAVGPALAKAIGGLAKDLLPLSNFLNSKAGAPVIDAIGKIIAGLVTVKGLAKLLPGALGTAVGGAPGLILRIVGNPLRRQLGTMFRSAFGGAAEEGEEAAAGALGNGGLGGMIGGLRTMLTGLPGAMAGVVEGIRGWGIWSAVASGATRVWAGIQAGFNLIMDANPIGIVVLAIAGLVIGVVEAYKHFTWFRDGVNDVFSVLKAGALFLWHNVFDPMWQGIKTGAEWLYDNAIRPLWNDWIRPVFDDVKAGIDFLSQHWSTIWKAMSTSVEAPVNFLINTVYDKGIARLWNDVVGAVGLGSLKLPVIAGLAHGGIVPGTDHGRDEVLIAARPEEGVLVPGAVRAIGGKPAVDALNSAHGGGGRGVPGHYSLGGIVSGFLSGGEDVAKAVAALATGNATAFTNALAPAIGTSASGELGQVMIAMPKTLVTDAAKAAIGMMGGKGGTSVPGNVAGWISQGMKVAGVSGADWQTGLDIIAMHESSGNANAVNNWDANAKAGTPSGGLLQFIQPTFAKYAMPGYTQWMNPVDQVIAAAWKGGYISSRYGSIDNVPGVRSVRQGGQYVGYDSGGWLPPGMTNAVNLTGKPEAVLTPEQSQALSRLAEGGGATAPAAPTVVNNWYGPQMPSQEMMAEMERRQSLTLSGG